jgi:hypothetical protein
MHEFVRDYEKKMSEKKLPKEVNLVGLELLNKDTTNV